MFNLPSVPDSGGKIFLSIGIALFVLVMYYSDKTDTEYNLEVKQNSLMIDQLNEDIALYNYNIQEFKTQAIFLSTVYQIENPLADTDSIVSFHHTYYPNANKNSISDSLWNIWLRYKKENFQLSRKSKQLDDKNEKLKKIKEDFKESEIVFDACFVMGAISFLFGLAVIAKDDSLKENLLKFQHDEKKVYRCCQSCGRTFNAMVINNINLNGNRSSGFCESCYTNGAFVDPSLTKQKVMADIIRSKGIKSRFRKKQIKKKVENLDRWKSTQFF